MSSTTSGNACSNQIETQQLSNTYDVHRAAVDPLGLPSNYAKTAASQNMQYYDLYKDVGLYFTLTFPSMTTVTVGGYNLNSVAPALDENYLTAVTNLATSVNTSSYYDMLYSFSVAYGFSYVQSVNYGAQTNTLVALTPANFGQLQKKGINVYDQQPSMFVYAKGSYTCVGSCPPFNTQDAQTIENSGQPQNISCMQSPESIPVPFTSSGGIDCTTYTQSAQTAFDNGQAVPVTYTLGEQTVVLRH